MEALERPMITVFGVFYLIALFIMGLWGYSQPGLTQTRLLTMDMWWGITLVAFASVYAMRFAKQGNKEECDQWNATSGQSIPSQIH